MRKSINKLKLLGISSCVPKKTIQLSDFYELFGENEVNRIAMSTGINSVRIATIEMTASDMCVHAAMNLITALNIDKNEIDGIVFISQTPDFVMPATSCILQNRLGLRQDIVAFDINYGCSGYIYGLLQSALLVSSGCCSKVLLCVGDTISKYLKPDDHKSRLVFGDGAAVSIIESGDSTWTFDIKTDGSRHKELIIPKSNNLDGYLHMNGSAIMEFAMSEVKGVIDSVLQHQNKSLNDISTVVLHQANAFMLNYLRKKLNVNKDIFPVEMGQYGNTGPASIPLAMCSKYHGSIGQLKHAVFAGFGVGLSWGAVLLDDIASTVILPVSEL
ncbi:MAG: ketoacyl-ACP synthase III [Burkholderiales bacterium]|nr:ketoacyl-ACP synthase III [Burkholderiales bacterium]